MQRNIFCVYTLTNVLSIMCYDDDIWAAAGVTNNDTILARRCRYLISMGWPGHFCKVINVTRGPDHQPRDCIIEINRVQSLTGAHLCRLIYTFLWKSQNYCCSLVALRQLLHFSIVRFTDNTVDGCNNKCNAQDVLCGRSHVIIIFVLLRGLCVGRRMPEHNYQIIMIGNCADERCTTVRLYYQSIEKVCSSEVNEIILIVVGCFDD